MLSPRLLQAGAGIKKERLILIDDDVPGAISSAVRAVCGTIENCKVWQAQHWNNNKGYKTRPQLEDLYRRAEIVVDWCMVGAERLPIEAVLYGAVMLTSPCMCGNDKRDFPIPDRNVLHSAADFKTAIPRIFDNYQREQRDYATMRSLYRGLNGTSMAREVYIWLKAMGELSPRTIEAREVHRHAAK